MPDSPNRSPDHGGEKWPLEFPRQRGAQQTGSHEPVRHLGYRRVLLQLHPEVGGYFYLFILFYIFFSGTRRCPPAGCSAGTQQGRPRSWHNAVPVPADASSQSALMYGWRGTLGKQLLLLQVVECHLEGCHRCKQHPINKLILPRVAA